MICTFIGHRDAPDKIRDILKSTIIDLIVNKNVRYFYVGNNGNFDKMATDTLRKLKDEYNQIKYSIVLAYLPTNKNEWDYKDYSDTVYFDELNYVPKKLVILKRNELMIKKSDFVITYVRNTFTNAYYFKTFAEKENKVLLNLYDML